MEQNQADGVQYADMSKLVLIDGNAIMHRAFHAIPPLTTPDQEPINAVYGFVSILLNVIQNLKPTHITVCFDEKEKTFRNELLPAYQSQRPPTHDDLISQFDKAREFLKVAGIPIYSKSGFEADDAIGTIADESKMDEVVIITGDRDILQLVDDRKGIKLFMPVGGLSNGKIYGEKETVERMGVTPALIPDLKGLIGDPSDNYKGVAGIGPVTATKLLNEFGSVDGIYENIDKVNVKVRDKLISGKKDAQMSHKLATIIKDVPIKIDFTQMDKWNLGSNEVLKLFQEFGFKTLSQRIISVNKKIEEENQEAIF